MGDGTVDIINGGSIPTHYYQSNGAYLISIEVVSDFTESSGSTTGLGDINYTAWFSPPTNGSLTWGFGVVTILPTATDSILGSGKFSLGPSFVLVHMTK